METSIKMDLFLNTHSKTCQIFKNALFITFCGNSTIPEICALSPLNLQDQSQRRSHDTCKDLRW